MSTAPPSEHPDEGPGEQPALSDEQWDAFLRQITQGGAGPAPEEPSARARMVARRLREQDEAAWRARRGRGRWPRRGKASGVPPAPPPGWRTGPAVQDADGARTRRRRIASVLGVALALAVAVVAVRPSLVLDRLPGRADPAASSAPLPAETAPPTAAPGEVEDAEPPTRAHPFRGSPALRWAEGADAIELPRAGAVDGMSADDVALALRRTKEFLVAANLDPEVLRGGRPEAAMRLLDPKSPGLMPLLERSLREPGPRQDPLMLFTRFDPKEVRLATDVVKVRGHMRVAAGERGVVRVHADYTFVYPLVRAHGDDDRVVRTVVRRALTMTSSDPSRWDVTEGKLLPERYDAEIGNSACEVYDGYLHPVFPGDASSAPATGPATDPYDRSRPPAAGQDGSCGRLTRS